MRSFLFFAFLVSSTLFCNAQTAQVKEVIVGYATLDLNDVDKIKNEAASLSGVTMKNVCYNHNVVIFEIDASVTDIIPAIIRPLKALKTSSVPEQKDGNSNGLVCESERPAVLIEKLNKQ